jgi:hypothetical protein
MNEIKHATEMKRLLSITLGQLRQLKEQNYLNEKGLEMLREFEEDIDKPYFCCECGENKVESAGDWCDDCNLPERSKIL